jgi:hypothetical protein
MLRVKYEKFDLCVSSICIICGAPYVMEHVEASLWEGDNFIGNLCQGCIRKGSKDFSKLLKQQAQQFRERTQIVEDLLDREISCPSWEDFQKELPAEKRDVLDKKMDPQTIRQITMRRMLLIGENVIPKEEMEKLTGEQINIFIKEPDPDKWPPEISHLKKYANMECDIQTFLRPEES